MNNNQEIEQLAGHLFVIAAASGTGKTSLVRALLEKIDNLDVSVSYTTRPPRPNDVDGCDYHFIDEATFQAHAKSGMFLESANVYGNHYGTSKELVFQALHHGKDLILEIDWQGAAQIKQQFPNAVTIFILPPSIQALRDRLEQRRSDSAEVITQRLDAAQEDIRHYRDYDYLVVNDDFSEAVQQLGTIIAASRLKQNCQKFHLQTLLAELV